MLLLRGSHQEIGRSVEDLGFPCIVLVLLHLPDALSGKVIGRGHRLSIRAHTRMSSCQYDSPVSHTKVQHLIPGPLTCKSSYCLALVSLTSCELENFFSITFVGCGVEPARQDHTSQIPTSTVPRPSSRRSVRSVLLMSYQTLTLKVWLEGPAGNLVRTLTTTLPNILMRGQTSRLPACT